MNEKSLRILVDCERMKYPQTGLYYFCLNLGLSLVNRMLQSEYKPVFYLPEKSKGEFETENEILLQHSFDKFLFPKTNRLDLWHSTYQGTMYYPFKSKIPVLLTIHDLNFMHDESKSQKKRIRYLDDLKRKIDRADAIAVISKFTQGEVEKYIPLNGKKCTVIYNGCNIKNIDFLKLPNYLPKKPFLFTIGTITEKKNFHVLTSLLKNNEYQLLIAGITQSETYKAKIIHAAKVLGVADRLVFVGAISENDKQFYYKNCEAFLFPSLAEGFGLPIIEAFYFGKAVFLSKATSLPEIGGKYAYYFDCFEGEHMQEVFSKGMEIYKNSNPAEEIVKYAKSFNWDISADKYMELYQSILNN